MVNNNQSFVNAKPEAMYGKIPPQAIEVEEAVLGALILENDSFEKVSDILTAKCFYKEDHQKIFNEIEILHRSDKRTDQLIIIQELKNKNILDDVGGVMAICGLSNKVASAAHIEFHARIIKQKFIQREIIRISTEIQTLAYDDTQDISDLLNLMNSELDSLNNGMNNSYDGKTSKEVAKSTMKEIEEDYKKAKENKLSGIDTGFYELNKATGGWKSPNLIILAARPGVGKTSLMLKFIITAAKAGFWCNVYGYEMLSEDLCRIILTGESDINRSRLRDGKIEEYEWEKLNKIVGNFENLPIIWYDKSDIKSNKIKMNTKNNIKEGKCQMVFVDYLQIVPPEDDKKNREEQISKISKNLKSITTLYKIPVMALAQLNREIERRSNPKPIKSDLRESGALEQDADIIIFPYMVNEDDQNREFRLNIGKHRRGRTGDFEIKFNDDMNRFWDETEYKNDEYLKPNINPNKSFYEIDKPEIPF